MHIKSFFVLLIMSFLSMPVLLAQSPVGVWKTIDDESGKATSYIEIYEKEGKLCGKIAKLLRDSEDSICEKCPGDLKNKPILGMEILTNLTSYKDYWSYGKIMDPENGKTYKCNVWFEEGNTDELHLRGYIGMAALGRNQVWQRVKG